MGGREHRLKFQRILALTSLVPLFSSGCGGSAVHAESKPDQELVAVTAQAIGHDPVTRIIRASGTLEPKREHTLSFKVGGVVAQVLVEEGKRVRQGQVLARLDATEVLAGESQAQQGLQKAERDAARARTLRDQNGIARSMVDDAETALEVARASAASAAFNLKHTELVAPSDGVVDRRMVEKGQIVGPGTPLFALSTADTKVVRVQLTDRDVLDLKLDDEAKVVLDARPELPLSARVTRIATLASPGAGTYEVELAVQDESARSLPGGLTAKVLFERIEHPRASVPLTALVGGQGDGSAVYVLEGDKVHLAPVRIAFISGEQVALVEGLEGAERVVSAGAEELSDGARVRLSR
ncbi:MAG: efflux RND transporter periplasmic adaptor subunit [Myxococcales bacterium]